MQERYAWVGILLVALIAGLTLYLVYTESDRPRRRPPRAKAGIAQQQARQEAAKATQRAAAILARRCAGCHDLRPVCRALGAKGKDAWDKTLTRMMFAGSVLTAGEKVFLRDWLWARTPGSSPPCAGRAGP